MTDLRKAAEMALEALEFAASEIYNEHNDDVIADAIKALRQALAQPEQEPVACVADLNEQVRNMFIEEGFSLHTALYTAPIGEPVKERISEPVGSLEPVAWMYDFLNTDNRDEVIRNWVTQDTADIEREKGFNVRPLYSAPPSKPEQEPIAYWNGKDMFKRADEVQYVVNWTDYFHYPLYSEPRSCPTCESLARTVMMDQTSHDTAPPSKPWVSLTDDERVKCYETTGHYQTLRPQDSFAVLSLARAIEAKLKEKNNG